MVCFLIGDTSFPDGSLGPQPLRVACAELTAARGLRGREPALHAPADVLRSMRGQSGARRTRGPEVARLSVVLFVLLGQLPHEGTGAGRSWTPAFVTPAFVAPSPMSVVVHRSPCARWLALGPRGAGMRTGISMVGGNDNLSRGTEGINELERARLALQGIIAKRKGQNLVEKTDQASRPDRKKDASKTLGAKIAASFPDKAAGTGPEVMTAFPVMSAAEHDLHKQRKTQRWKDQHGPRPAVTTPPSSAADASPARPERADGATAEGAGNSRAVSRSKRVVASAVPIVEWAVPEEELGIVEGDETTVRQAKINLKEFEAANTG